MSSLGIQCVGGAIHGVVLKATQNQIRKGVYRLLPVSRVGLKVAQKHTYFLTLFEGRWWWRAENLSVLRMQYFIKISPGKLKRKRSLEG